MNFEYWRLFSLIESIIQKSLKVKTESMAEGADISIKKCMTRKHLSICLVLMNLMQNIPVRGRVFIKKSFDYAFFYEKT